MKLAVLALCVAAIACDKTTSEPLAKPAPEPPPGPQPLVDIGTDAPLAGFQPQEEGHWFVLCQARNDTDGDGKLSVKYELHYNQGDVAEPYLVLGGGAGELVEPAAETVHGGYLAVVRDHHLELIDARTSTFQRTALTADLRNDGDWRRSRNARFVSFADDGARMTYIRPDNTIVIRELPSGRERAVAMAELVWRADIQADGRWAVVETIPSDTDHDGQIAWPGGPARTSLRGCNVDTMHYQAPDRGDAVKTRWLELATGQLVDDPTVVGSLGGELLRRTAEGALVLGSDPIVPASCHAHIDGVIELPGVAARAVVMCNPGAPDQQVPVAIAGHGVFETTHVKAYPATDSAYPRDRFERIDDTTYVDLADGSDIKLPGKHVSGYMSRYLLIAAADGYAAYDLERRVATPLHAGPIDQAKIDQAQIDVEHDIATLDGALYDLRSGKLVTRSLDRVAFVATSGRVLRYAAMGAPNEAPSGPLRWDP